MVDLNGSKSRIFVSFQNVPKTVLSYVWPDEDLRVSPLVALEPRRRRFHCPVQIMLYLPQVSKISIISYRSCSSSTGICNLKNIKQIMIYLPQVSTI